MYDSVKPKLNMSFHFFFFVTALFQVKDLVKFAESSFGPVDILVNNAGVFYYSLMKNLHEDLWERTVDVNCKVTHYDSRHTLFPRETRPKY